LKALEIISKDTNKYIKDVVNIRVLNILFKPRVVGKQGHWDLLEKPQNIAFDVTKVPKKTSWVLEKKLF
jgi:hypothetical protein